MRALRRTLERALSLLGEPVEEESVQAAAESFRPELQNRYRRLYPHGRPDEWCDPSSLDSGLRLANEAMRLERPPDP